MSTSSSGSGGTGPLFLLFLTFLILKLTGVIDWSWWWVTAPLWIPFALMLAFTGIVLLAFALMPGRKTWQRTGRFSFKVTRH